MGREMYSYLDVNGNGNRTKNEWEWNGNLMTGMEMEWEEIEVRVAFLLVSSSTAIWLCTTCCFRAQRGKRARRLDVSFGRKICVMFTF